MKQFIFKQKDILLELIEDGLSQINIVVIDNLLKKVETIEPIFFEQLILDLMEK